LNGKNMKTIKLFCSRCLLSENGLAKACLREVSPLTHACHLFSSNLCAVFIVIRRLRKHTRISFRVTRKKHIFIDGTNTLALALGLGLPLGLGLLAVLFFVGWQLQSTIDSMLAGKLKAIPSD